MKSPLLTALLATLSVAALAAPLSAHDETLYGHTARCRATLRPWNGNYYYIPWGHRQPVSLVVPPTAELQTNYGWGVCGTRVTRINHQFQRPYPGPYGGGYGFMAKPQYPSDTQQFGVYYIRGPW
jgi:hypothetical protein